MKPTRISAKDLGALAMPDFCPKCFWVKRKVKSLPFQIFPGIFNSIDAYSKKIVHARFDLHNAAPECMLEALKDAVSYLPPPSWQKFQRTDPATGITVSGAPDGYFVTQSGAHILPDYKTARYTAGQDKLLPLYEAQQNGYRWIDEGLGFQVHSTPLVYCEPKTEISQTELACHCFEDSFAMEFSVKVVEIPHQPGLIPLLLQLAKEILDLTWPPEGRDGCKDCESVRGLVELLNPGLPPNIIEALNSGDGVYRP